MATRDRLHRLPGLFSLGRCPRCRSVGQDWPCDEDQLLAYYPPDYAPYRRIGLTHQVGASLGLRTRERHIASLRLPPGRILDVGCATGRFLTALQKRGWTVSGLELNPEVAQRARQELGLDVRVGTLESAKFSESSFDLVTMWDVLEHVCSPMRTMREVQRILRPGGWFVFRVPNPESLGARLFGARWAGWDQPRHIWLPTRAAFAGALPKVSLRLQRISGTGGRFALAALSARNTLVDWCGHSVALRILSTLVGSLPARLLLTPYFAISGTLGQGSLLTYYAQKPAES